MLLLGTYYLYLDRDLVLLDLTGILLVYFFSLFSLFTGLAKAISILVFIFDKLLEEILDNDCYLYIKPYFYQKNKSLFNHSPTMIQISHQLPTFLPEDSEFYSISCYLPWHYTFHKVHYCMS